MEKIEIGNSDYSREEIENGSGISIGTSPKIFYARIREFENAGYTVKFETSLWQKIFGLSKYKVNAYK